MAEKLSRFERMITNSAGVCKASIQQRTNTSNTFAVRNERMKQAEEADLARHLPLGQSSEVEKVNIRGQQNIWEIRNETGYVARSQVNNSLQCQAASA
jgi:hypothetical protein